MISLSIHGFSDLSRRNILWWWRSGIWLWESKYVNVTFSFFLPDLLFRKIYYRDFNIWKQWPDCCTKNPFEIDREIILFSLSNEIKLQFEKFVVQYSFKYGISFCIFPVIDIKAWADKVTKFFKDNLSNSL